MTNRWWASAEVAEVSCAIDDEPFAPTSGRPLLVLLRHGPVQSQHDVRDRFVLRPDIVACIAIGPVSQPHASAIVAASRRALAQEISSLVLFVEDRDPPSITYRPDPPIDAVLMPAAIALSVVPESRSPEHAAYAAISAVLSPESAVRQLLVRNMGRFEDRAPTSIAPFTLGIPHRGPFAMLRTCMHYVRCQHDPPARVHVYFDEHVSDAHHDWLATNADIEAFTSSETGVGPYVARHHLASEASTPWIMFQDSDDASCSDRITVLSSALDMGEMIGSHEVRVDEFRELVYPIRFPLDVSAALAIRPSHALLHPTSVISKAAYARSGGFSTNRVMGNDSQFLLRAFFSMRISNVDAFLYVKRDRAGSLTRADATVLGSPERRRLNTLWEDAFLRVRDARATLEHTPLAVEHTDQEPIVRIQRLASDARCHI